MPAGIPLPARKRKSRSFDQSHSQMPDYQIGVFPIAKDINPARIVLVTSRNGKRWIFPKGNPEKGRSDKEVALEEGYEEAGILGTITSKYEEFEVRYGSTRLLRLYRMDIDGFLADWPERGQRRRLLVTVKEASQLLEPDLRACLKKLSKLHLSPSKE